MAFFLKKALDISDNVRHTEIASDRIDHKRSEEKKMKKRVQHLFIVQLCVSVFFFAFTGCTPQKSTSGSGNLSSETSESADFSSLSSAPISQNNVYANPVYPLVEGEKAPTYTADPFVIRGDDGLFYLYCTQTDVYTGKLTDGRTFLRGPTFTSPDLVNWVYCGDVFSSYVPDWGTSGAGVWAPTVAKIGDRYVFYYSLSTGGDENPGIGVATSPTPNGPWTHYGKLFDSEEIGVVNSIDPYVFIDEGNVYMAFGSYGGLITLIQLTDDGLGLYGGLEYQREHKVPLAGFEIYDMTNYEGTIITRYGDYYYLFLSTGTCLSGTSSTYHVVVARSENLFGPYLDADGNDLFRPNQGEYVVTPIRNHVMGVGHCAVIEDDLGELWMLYHGYDCTDEENSDKRVLYLDKLVFSEDGFPHVENYRASNHTDQNGPYLFTLEGRS